MTSKEIISKHIHLPDTDGDIFKEIESAMEEYARTKGIELLTEVREFGATEGVTWMKLDRWLKGRIAGMEKRNKRGVDKINLENPEE